MSYSALLESNVCGNSSEKNKFLVAEMNYAQDFAGRTTRGLILCVGYIRGQVTGYDLARSLRRLFPRPEGSFIQDSDSCRAATKSVDDLIGTIFSSEDMPHCNLDETIGNTSVCVHGYLQTQYGLTVATVYFHSQEIDHINLEAFSAYWRLGDVALVAPTMSQVKELAERICQQRLTFVAPGDDQSVA